MRGEARAHHHVGIDDDDASSGCAEEKFKATVRDDEDTYKDACAGVSIADLLAEIAGVTAPGDEAGGPSGGDAAGGASGSGDVAPPAPPSKRRTLGAFTFDDPPAHDVPGATRQSRQPDAKGKATVSPGKHSAGGPSTPPSSRDVNSGTGQSKGSGQSSTPAQSSPLASKPGRKETSLPLYADECLQDLETADDSSTYFSQDGAVSLAKLRAANRFVAKADQRSVGKVDANDATLKQLQAVESVIKRGRLMSVQHDSAQVLKEWGKLELLAQQPPEVNLRLSRWFHSKVLLAAAGDDRRHVTSGTKRLVVIVLTCLACAWNASPYHAMLGPCMSQLQAYTQCVCARMQHSRNTTCMDPVIDATHSTPANYVGRSSTHFGVCTTSFMYVRVRVRACARTSAR